MLMPAIPEAAVWAIYFAPIASFVVIAVGLRARPIDAGRLTIAAIGLSWLLALWALDSSLSIDGEAMGFPLHEWVRLFDLEVTVGVRLDGLTAVMLVVVTSVSLLVQIYSTGYMRGDGGYSRYFAYMSLFTAAMLGLVLSASLLQLFVHWELVGLSSYLLIGFWFHKPAAAAAAKKAFIVTRFGDFGLLLAVLLIWSQTGTFEIAAINAAAGGLSEAVLTAFTLGLLAGAVGKSAQFPLHIWLPDAMEGPTPVSALIHAATMVVAGVYLIARFFPSFEAAPSEVMSTVAYIGGFTALLAATMGIVATDIKRVLAYSTISQLGYMVMAIGLGGYVAAIFHLFTHAFFKSLLFMGAGSVNHATNSFDMRRMGGLRSFMPVTFATFVIGSLSLAGFFPLAGFWSKDEILLDAWNHDRLLFGVAVLTAGLTALYMGRVIFMTFFGEYRGGEAPEEGHGHVEAGSAYASGVPHESGLSMAGVLALLAIPAIGIGWFTLGGGFGRLVEGALVAGMVEHPFEFHTNSVVLVSSTVAALAGAGIAAAIWFARRPSPESLQRRAGPLHTLLVRKYYVDEIAEDGAVRGLLNGFAGRLSAAFDTYVVDGAVDLIASLTRRVGGVLRRSSTGHLQAATSLYVIGLLVAVVVLFVLSANVLEP
ncbi:MAG: NADH-quinone oxidoreductase subunit L [Dehalococcoidia bacterium]